MSFFGYPTSEEVAIQLIEGLENGTLVLDEPGEDTPVPQTGAGGSDGGESAATLRHSTFSAIARSVRELAALGADDRFLFAVDAAITQIEAALRSFADLKREGNTREILRSLLNTLRNGGWDRLRAPATPRAIEEFLTPLATAEWITPEQVEAFHLLIEDLELESLSLPPAQWPE